MELRQEAFQCQNQMATLIWPLYAPAFDKWSSQDFPEWQARLKGFQWYTYQTLNDPVCRSPWFWPGHPSWQIHSGPWLQMGHLGGRPVAAIGSSWANSRGLTAQKRNITMGSVNQKQEYFSKPFMLCHILFIYQYKYENRLITNQHKACQMACDDILLTRNVLDWLVFSLFCICI